MNKAYFTNIRSEIIPHLRNAKSTIKIAMAWFTSGELFQELLDCIKRDVNVELVLLDNPTNFMEFAPDFNVFIKAGGIFRLAHPENGFMHHKFCVIDNSIVINGSYNWTYNAENKNIENITISDVPSVVSEFTNEFHRLTKNIHQQNKSPRLTWSEIEQRNDVDYREINSEISYICEIRNLPIRKEVKPSTTVQIVETQKIPHAKFDIGIEVSEDGEPDFAPFILKGQKLPYKSETVSFYMDTKNEKHFPCRIIYGNPHVKGTWKLIKEDSLMPVANNILNENLKIQFSIYLDVNGSLRTDVVCPESSHTMMISALKTDLVKYE